jgi:hypothetical protein
MNPKLILCLALVLSGVLSVFSAVRVLANSLPTPGRRSRRPGCVAIVGNTQYKLAFWTVLAALCIAFNAQATSYQEWIASYARTNLAIRGFSGSADEVLFIVTSVEGDGASPTNWVGSIFPKVVEAGSIVSTTGFVYGFVESFFETSGTTPMRPTISGEDLKQLGKLLAKLPGDGARLPPPDRRLLVQADVRGHLLTRVYDRANLPDRLREILRLAGCRVQAWVPQFAPDNRVDSCGVEFGGFLALSPNRQQILYALMNRPLQFWDPTTHELLAEIRGLPDVGSSMGCLACSPDGSKAASVGDYAEGFCLETKTWKVLKKFHKPQANGGYYTPSWPVFTADGRHLLLQYPDDLAIFDTATWQRVDRLPEVPQAALQYIPAPDNKRAVVTLKSGAVVLWDVPRQRSVATLAQNVRLSQVSFSSDGSLFATVTDATNDFSKTSHSMQLRIWQSRNGRLATEIGLDGQTAWPYTFEHLLWSPDGEYLLTVAHIAGGSSGVDIFNVKTGRNLGYLSGPMGDMNGLILLPGGSQLVAGGNDGKIYFWDFNAVMNLTKSFERSLAD